MDPVSRVLTRDEAVRRFGPPRDFRLVFTNGCFDLLHQGHVSLLNRARELGERLVVGLNSDASVRRLKGPSRPFFSSDARAYVLASLRSVDAVVVFGEDTPESLVRALLPDVLVKGADYRREEIAGVEAVEAAGGRLCLLSLVKGLSTTRLAGRLEEGREPT